jgi:hypothetical protein
LLLYLVVDFGQQVIIFHRQNRDLHSLDEQIAGAQQERAALLENLAYAESDEAAEKWARQLGWSREDEKLVFLVGPEVMDSPKGEDDSLEPPAGPATPQEAWWDLFFARRNRAQR